MPALSRAIAAARSGGPAVLLLPKNIQQAEIDCNPGSDELRSRHQIGDPRPIARALRRAVGPITIIAGEQVARDDARAELEQLRATLRARVATVPDAKDVAGTPGRGSSSALGVTGVMGHPGVAEAVAGSGLCLIVGTRLPVTARAGLDDGAGLGAHRVAGLGARPTFRARTSTLTTFAGRWRCSRSRFPGRDGRPESGSPTRCGTRELTPPPFEGSGVRYRDAMTVLDAVLPDGTDIVVDAGNTGAAAIHYLPVRRDGRFVVALGMGGMGYSFGAGIGMAFAAMSRRAKSNGQRPRRTVVIAGDGAFFMHGMEIHTAVQYRLPMTFVLFNNNAHAMCVTREQLFYDDLYSYNRFEPSRPGRRAGRDVPGPAIGRRRSTPRGWPTALRMALDTDGPSVVSVECAADEIPPFAPFLAAAAPKSEVVNNHSIAKEKPSDVVTRA